MLGSLGGLFLLDSSHERSDTVVVLLLRETGLSGTQGLHLHFFKQEKVARGGSKC